MHLFYICGPSRKKGPSGRNFQGSSLQFRKQERFLIKTMYELVCIQSYLWLPFAISGGKKTKLKRRSAILNVISQHNVILQNGPL